MPGRNEALGTTQVNGMRAEVNGITQHVHVELVKAHGLILKAQFWNGGRLEAPFKDAEPGGGSIGAPAHTRRKCKLERVGEVYINIYMYSICIRYIYIYIYIYRINIEYIYRIFIDYIYIRYIYIYIYIYIYTEYIYIYISNMYIQNIYIYINI